MTESQIISISEIPEIQKVEPSTATAVQGQFSGFFDQVRTLAEASLSVRVVSVEDKDGMAQARALRLSIGRVRREADEVRIRLKADSLNYGKLVQSVFNIIEVHAKKAETHLQAQEDFATLQAIRLKAELKAQRDSGLSAFAEFVPFGVNTGDLSEEDFQKLLGGARLQYQHKIEAEEKAKEEARILAEKKEEEDREMRKENERLKKLSEENTARIRAEQEARKKAEQENNAKLEVERQARLMAEKEIEAQKKAKEKEEDEAKEVEKERGKIERNKKYKEWLAENNFNQNTDRVLMDEGVYKIYRLVSTFNS